MKLSTTELSVFGKLYRLRMTTSPTSTVQLDGLAAGRVTSVIQAFIRKTASKHLDENLFPLGRVTTPNTIGIEKSSALYDPCTGIATVTDDVKVSSLEVSLVELVERFKRHTTIFKDPVTVDHLTVTHVPDEHCVGTF